MFSGQYHLVSPSLALFSRQFQGLFQFFHESFIDKVLLIKLYRALSKQDEFRKSYPISKTLLVTPIKI